MLDTATKGAREDECRKVLEGILNKNNCKLNIRLIARIGQAKIDILPSLIKEGVEPIITLEAIDDGEPNEVVETKDDDNV
jgi:hypothetical protein